MEITHLSLAKVAHDATFAPAELRDVDDGIDAFLGAHITGLRAMTTRNGTSPGSFTDPEARRLFRNLYSGSDNDFLTAADTLTKRLISKMDARTASGLLVCLRAHDAQEQYGGVLKLQVVAQHAAVLEELASGQVGLSAVRDLLDKPGDLQKGVLSTSWLAENRIMIGDQLGQDAAYFPKAFDIQVYARPAAAASELLAAIEVVSPELVMPTAAALPSVPSDTPETVLAALGHKVPELTPDIQADVADVLARQARPVARIDTGRVTRETITAGEIKISGPVSQMRQYVQVERADGMGSEQWTITVTSLREPKRTYRT